MKPVSLPLDLAHYALVNRLEALEALVDRFNRRAGVAAGVLKATKRRPRAVAQRKLPGVLAETNSRRRLPRLVGPAI